jgi:hypothetical protein
LSLFALPLFAAPKYLKNPESYLWEKNESQTGRFVLRLVGDGGSSVTINYQFHGFYVGYFAGTLDRLIPIKTNIKMSSVVRRVYGNSETIDEFKMHSQVYSDVPTLENSNTYTAPFQINWDFGRRPEFVQTSFRVNEGMLILSPHSGRGDQMHPATFSGMRTSVTEETDGGCTVDKDEISTAFFSFETGDTLDPEDELNESLSSVSVPLSQLPEAIRTEDRYKYSHRMNHLFDRDGGISTSHCVVGNGDQSVDLSMNLDVNFLHETEMYLSPMIYETEAKWMPTPGDIRFYRLHLKKTFGEIEAIQFGLDEVSEHPGVATNAGYYKHCLIPPRQTDEERWETDGVISDRSNQSCPDLGGDHIADDWYTSAMYKSKYSVPNRFHEYTFERSYMKFSKSPVDNMPDVFFTDLDQEPIADHYPDIEYTIVDPKHYDPGMGYSYSYSDKVEIIQQLRQIGKTDHLAWRNAYFAFVRIMDYGASARLFADIKIDGEWQRATAWGDNAYGKDYGDYYGNYLLIPNDQNRDGIQDQWARDHNVNEPIEDLDTHLGAQFLGDGLTAFEEYRGLIYDNSVSRNQLTHYRTSPVEKQIFVHPFGNDVTLIRLLLKEPNSARSIYDHGGLKLVVLAEDEFEDEIVNYNETVHRSGSQYVIVPMTKQQFSRVAYAESVSAFTYQYLKNIGGKASSVGPPRQNENTLVIVSMNARTLAHEIGHQVNIHHPGNKDLRWIDDKYVAVKHGEHSGNVQSVMRYRVADYLCDSHWTICETQALLGKIHADWIPVSWEPSVFDELLFDPVQYIFSQDGKGTGVNSNNSMAGDAERDGDLPQLNVKSY